MIAIQNLRRWWIEWTQDTERPISEWKKEAWTMTMDDLAAHVRKADEYLRAGECIQAAQSCLTAAGVARALYLARVEAVLVKAAADVLLPETEDDAYEDVR